MRELQRPIASFSTLYGDNIQIRIWVANKMLMAGCRQIAVRWNGIRLSGAAVIGVRSSGFGKAYWGYAAIYGQLQSEVVCRGSGFGKAHLATALYVTNYSVKQCAEG